eukprot:TRINITY_DN7062_c0_g1_i1.p1 TRINITY_DN7062_c0_g1~~TRINITY_DN7062_c0_g1_i1.p1  ORF type:complete len:558 (-),score=158.09 TRINITY_DN7062_c0_g1_i1:42-1715(-)
MFGWVSKAFRAVCAFLFLLPLFHYLSSVFPRKSVQQAVQASPKRNQVTYRITKVPMEASRPSSDRVVSSLELQRKYHKEAYEVISLGLDLDQQSPSDAASFYSKGINILRKAVRLEFTPDEWEEAKETHEKMKKNLDQIEARYQEIVSEQGGSGLATLPVATKGAKDVVDLTDGPASSTRSQTKSTGSKKNPTPGKVASASSASTAKTSSRPSSSAAPASSAAKKSSTPGKASAAASKPLNSSQNAASEPPKGNPEILKGIDPKMQEAILNEVVDRDLSVAWDDIAGLDQAKAAIKEMVIYPMLRPDIFSGLRTPSRGLLLFGPPGNGKTFLAKALASEAKATFFSITSSTLTSRWLGDSEKMVKALFAVARYLQPSMIFIDEIDALLSSRSTSEHEASRRLKNEFLIQFDGVASNSDDRIFVMGATNRPADLDEAARRRFTRRIYIPLPGPEGRAQIIKNLLKKVNKVHLTDRQFNHLVQLTESYSGSDLTSLCKDAAMEPVREIGSALERVDLADVRPIQFKDFEKALQRIRPSVSRDSLRELEDWNKQFGSLSS